VDKRDLGIVFSHEGAPHTRKRKLLQVGRALRDLRTLIDELKNEGQNAKAHTAKDRNEKAGQEKGA
jgi:hypothetical protein